jgi:CDP-glucose 4,6-dehydratase
MNKQSLLDHFSGKKVFITGHTGFKGSWLAYLLHYSGAKIKGFSLQPLTEVNHFSGLQLEKKLEHVVGDITNFSHLRDALVSFEPDYVFHLAAQALVNLSYINPIETFNTNIMGSANVLEATRQCNSVRSLVYITSDKCYENVEWLWGYRENDQLGGRDPYSASKASAELIFSSYLRSFLSEKSSLGAASTRAGNVIGGGDWSADRIIPDCIRAFKNGEVVTLRNPYSTRPWQHVLEPLSGYLQLAVKLFEHPKKYSGSWNFGPAISNPLTVEDVTRSMIEHFGQGKLEITKTNHPHHEANLLQLNCEKANQMLNWLPRWSATKAIEQTASWYKRFYEGESAELITQSQIAEYFLE